MPPTSQHPLFASLESSPRLAALDAQGTGGGVLLSLEQCAALLAAATQVAPALDAEIRDATLRAHLAPYALGTGWRILYDCQRELLLAALTADQPAPEVAGPQRRRRAA